MVEIIVVLAILGLLVSLSSAVFVSLRNDQALRVATEDIFLTLRTARTLTLAAKNDTAYGVAIDADKVTRFVGTTYTVGLSTNVEYSFPDGVTAVATLSNGGSTTIFARLTGEASATGTVMLTSSHTGATSSVTIGDTGILTVER